jgi:bacterial/archaeal transporter family protein
MRPWMIYSIATLVLWGLWGFFIRLSSAQVNTQSVIVFTVVGAIAGMVAMFFLMPAPLALQPWGVTYGILSGLAMILGMLTITLALTRGPTSVVVMLTALYPLVTILLVFLVLKEPVTIRQGLGMLLAVGAMVLMAV